MGFDFGGTSAFSYLPDADETIDNNVLQIIKRAHLQRFHPISEFLFNAMRYNGRNMSSRYGYK